MVAWCGCLSGPRTRDSIYLCPHAIPSDILSMLYHRPLRQRSLVIHAAAQVNGATKGNFEISRLHFHLIWRARYSSFWHFQILAPFPAGGIFKWLLLVTRWYMMMTVWCDAMPTLWWAIFTPKSCSTCLLRKLNLVTKLTTIGHETRVAWSF